MNTFMIPAGLNNYRSLADRTLRITFETGELSPEEMSKIHYALQQHGFLVFSPDVLTTKELEDINNIKVEFDDGGKSPAWRLRAVLYRNWEQSAEGFDTFEMYYKSKMEKFINHLKGTLL